MLNKKLSGATAAAAPSLYIEDVFQAWLRTGTGADVTVTNNIDMTEGYMLWTKGRSGATDHAVYDSARGVTKDLVTNSTAAETTQSTGLKSVSSTGYTVGSLAKMNTSSATYVDWTFRKAEKFFDVVTYTGNGSNPRTVNHNLGSTPGCIIIKQYSAAGENWIVWHRSVGDSQFLVLNANSAVATDSRIKTVGSTSFQVSANDSVNASGATYVAYLFAHDAGGFGDAGDQSVIKCGSFAHNFSGATVNLGWEPQWVLVKAADQVNNWYIFDNMRGIATGGDDAALFPNLSDAENLNSWGIDLTATGFTVSGNNILSSGNAIYIAIRRGPMKTPTDATTVFTPVVRTGTNGTTSYSSLSFSPDLVIGKARANTYSPAPTWTTKLTGTNAQLGSSSTNAETTASDAITGWLNTGYNLGADNSLGNYNLSTTASNYVSWNFGRAPGFFDVVCYTGTGVARTVNHNLGVAPELMIVKCRSVGGTNRGWWTYAATLGNTKALEINSTNNAQTASVWNNTTPTASVFSVDNTYLVNENGTTYVAYLFATLAGVSKVGSYTGNGSSQTINCGFTAGARFVLIKQTDSTGDWVVFDSARGIVSGNDPYLELNTTDAEVTNKDAVDTDNTGFVVNETTGPNVNTNSATYIYLAIA